MCCHHTIEIASVSSGLAIKDFIAPTAGLIGTLITVFAGYRFLSLQARKNRKLKLIEDLRKEVARFHSQAVKSQIEALRGEGLLEIITAVDFLIDDNDSDQRELVSKMTEINNGQVESPFHNSDYAGLTEIGKRVIQKLIKQL